MADEAVYDDEAYDADVVTVDDEAYDADVAVVAFPNNEAVTPDDVI